MANSPKKPEIHCKYDKLVPVNELQPHPKNRNTHPKEQIERLAKILNYQGWRYPIKVSNRSGFVTSGHGRIEAAKKNGWEKVPVNYQDYKSTKQEYADVQSDNAIASWAELDLSSIQLDLKDLKDFDVDLLGIKDFELDVSKEGLTDEDATPEARETKIVLGDLFSLGNHRLLCGDSTDKKQVERLMNGEKADMVFTDPPYGMNLDTDFGKAHANKDGRHSVKSLGEKSNAYRRVHGDAADFNPEFLLKHFDYCEEIFLFGADYYCWSLPKDGAWFVWDKRVCKDGHAMENVHGSEFELCWSKQKHKRMVARILHTGLYSIENDKRQHPTQKPVALAVWVFDNWGKESNVVVDLYCGSGFVFLACEKTNRKCYGMEIDPQYCQVIIDRWEKYTGRKAEKIGTSKETNK